MRPDAPPSPMRVVVAYASAHGSTREIAEHIGQVLRANGIPAEVRSIDQAWSPEPYDAAIIGSAIHNQAWLPAAAAFMRDHADELARRQVWLFSVGMPGALAWPFRKLAMREGPVVSAPFLQVGRSRGHKLFTGVVRPDQMSSLGRMAFRAVGGRFGDFRDWEEIDAWADAIADDLSVVRPMRRA